MQKEVAAMLKGRILVGHALHNDLKVRQAPALSPEVSSQALSPQDVLQSHPTPFTRLWGSGPGQTEMAGMVLTGTSRHACATLWTACHLATHSERAHTCRALTALTSPVQFLPECCWVQGIGPHGFSDRCPHGLLRGHCRNMAHLLREPSVLPRDSARCLAAAWLHECLSTLRTHRSPHVVKPTELGLGISCQPFARAWVVTGSWDSLGRLDHLHSPTPSTPER